MTDLKTNIGYEELIDYINDRSSVDMRESIKQWLTEDVRNQKMFNELKAYYEGKGDFKDVKFDTARALHKLHSRINRKKILSFTRIAAIVILIISFSFIFKFIDFDKEVERIIVINNMQKPKKFVLPDESIAWISTNSQISYNKDFKGKTRMIEMKGHVFFSVMKNPNKAFEVFANDVYIKVLGTSFDVNEGLEKTELKVETGRVLFAEKVNIENQMLIVKDESAVFLSESSIIVKKNIDDSNYKSWFTGIIKFKGEKIQDACKYLSSFYAREIELKNPQDSTKRLTTVIDNLSIDEVKESIEFALDIELELK